MKANSSLLSDAGLYLQKADSHLAPIIDRVGVCSITPHSNYYQALVDSIIGQQLSVKAAHSIRTRFYGLFDGDGLPTPEQIVAMPANNLRTAGLSGAKARYVQDLAQHVIDKKLTFNTIESLSNDEIVTMLTAVNGIGEWTAHMFMMFCMGRTDILPIGDLGIKNGIMKLYGLDHLPNPEQIREIAVKYHWHPYESVASWYLWQSLE